MTPEMNDHDLLITIHTQLQRALADIDNLSRTLMAEKMNKADADRMFEASEKAHADHESRLRRVEKYGMYAIGIIGFIEVLSFIAIVITVLKR